MRMLYDVALDLYDKQSNSAVVSFKSPAHRRYSEVSYDFDMYVSNYVSFHILTFYFLGCYETFRLSK